MWQPIETAPRNQTFLAVLNCGGEQTICTMRWPVAEAKNSRPDSKTFHVERVTHWMPLPGLPGAQPTPSFADAYQGAMEEVAIWKKRALEAEELNRKFIAEINGATHMGEPAQPAPSVPDDVIEQAVSRFLSWKLPKDFHPDGGMVFIPTKGRGHDSPHWPCGTNLFNAQQAREMLRYVLAKAPEVKP